MDIRYFKPVLDSGFLAVDSPGIGFGFLVTKPGFLIPIELFIDTAAISNLLDLRSIMGCPGGIRSVFTGAFRANRELYCIFHGKNAIIITSKHGKMIFFFHYNLYFLGKLKEKLARKARVNTERVYWIVLMPLAHPIILLKSNKFNMAAVSVKRFIVSEILDSLSWIIRRIQKSCIPKPASKSF